MAQAAAGGVEGRGEGEAHELPLPVLVLGYVRAYVGLDEKPGDKDGTYRRGAASLRRLLGFPVLERVLLQHKPSLLPVPVEHALLVEVSLPLHRRRSPLSMSSGALLSIVEMLTGQLALRVYAVLHLAGAVR